MTEFSKSSEEPTPKPDELETAGELAPPSEPEERSAAQPEVSGEAEAETAVKLSQPSKELATRLLRKVSFKERVIGFRSNPGPGDLEESFYSFEEAARFLDGGDLSGEGWVNSIRFDTLKKWVGETLGDKELALAIGEITKKADQPMTPYQQDLKNLRLIPPVKALMEQRLKQCEEILGIPHEETEA